MQDPPPARSLWATGYTPYAVPPTRTLFVFVFVFILIVIVIELHPPIRRWLLVAGLSATRPLDQGAGPPARPGVEASWVRGSLASSSCPSPDVPPAGAPLDNVGAQPAAPSRSRGSRHCQRRYARTRCCHQPSTRLDHLTSEVTSSLPLGQRPRGRMCNVLLKLQWISVGLHRPTPWDHHRYQGAEQAQDIPSRLPHETRCHSTAIREANCSGERLGHGWASLRIFFCNAMLSRWPVNLAVTLPRIG